MKKTKTITNRTIPFTTNWLARIPLWVSCLASICLSACDENEQIGLNLQGSQVLNTIFTDTLSIESSVVYLDSINTTNTASILVGNLSDERFGNTTAIAYSQLSIGITTDLDFGERPVFDSITMRLQYKYTYGDTLTPQTYQIHELTDPIDTIQYYNFDTIDGIGEQIGEFTYAPGRDSLNFVTFRLSDAWGQKLLNKGGEPELADQASFAEFVKGIRLQAISPATQSVIGFDPSGARSFITLHYRTPSADTLAPRTFRFTFGRGFHFVDADLNNALNIKNLERGESIPTSQTNHECMLQAGTGITTLIRFPHLTSLGDGQRILVNRAELFFRPVDELNTDPFKLPPFSVFLKKATEEGIPGNFIGKELSFNEAAVSQYNTAGRMYPPIRITSYIQSLIDGNEPNTGIFLSLSPTQEKEAVNHVIIADPEHPTNPSMELRVYYTILDSQE